jgi:glutamate-ammonia-ligase adenylyltransferase
MLAEVNSWLEPLLDKRDYRAALAHLRQFKERERLRIAARDLAQPGRPEEIIQEISDLADVCLESVWRTCWLQLTERHGQPWHQDAGGRWHPTASCVIGLGKLGGEELNYSSDVDVIFVYEEEGSVFKERPGNSEESSPPQPSPRGRGFREARLRAKNPLSSKAAKVPPSPLSEERAGERRPLLPVSQVGSGSHTSGQTSAQARPTLSNHQFFNRLTEAFVAELTRLAPEGMLYRIDVRLRPEGDAGPLSRSLAGYENYYAQWGQTWERMMLLKARPIAGSGSLGAEFIEMVQAFRYPRSINENVLREVEAMKQRIENEVVRAGELERNVKLGRGGIREIEFIVQVFQLLHAGRQPFLQSAQTLPCLQKLVQYELLGAEDAQSLAAAYRFLRDLEHRLQMEDDRQTHTVPAERSARERLAKLMAFPTLKAFESAWQAHTREVRRLFDKALKGEVPEFQTSPSFPREFEGAEEEWKMVLADHGFRDVAKAFRVLREFVEGPGYVHVSPRTKELAGQLLPRLFALCPGHRQPEVSGQSPDARRQGLTAPLSDPDRVVTRLDSFIVAYGARATLFEMWNSNPGIFELLVLLFDRSEFLAERAIRTPDLVDELVTSGRLRQRKSAEETLRDLRHGLADADQQRWLRLYHQAEQMRVGLRDILGLAEFEQYLTELSALAEACLQYALEVVLRKNRIAKAPFVIIGLGKLGGREIDYGSDLDIVFVAEPKAKNLPLLARLALQVLDLLSSRTPDGMVFHTDARLRPDGEKGLLVNTLKAYEDYYRQRAQLWEIQSLTRARPVAGDQMLGGRFAELAAGLTNFRAPSLPLAAFAPDWRQKIHQMRMRIEKERTPPGKDELAIKTGKGGLVDAEFVAQALSLEHGWQEPNTLNALQRAQAANVLPRADELIDGYRRLRSIEGILRRWSYEGETVLPDAPAPYYRVSVRCGFATPEAFRAAIAAWRKVIREVYLMAMGQG